MKRAERREKSRYTTVGLLLLLACFTVSAQDNEGGTIPEELVLTLPGKVSLVVIKIPAGSFQMGSSPDERGHSPKEGPLHTVTFEKDFYMGKYELTQQQWLAVMGAWPEPMTMETSAGTGDDSKKIQEYHFEPTDEWGKGENYPAYSLSWNDARLFMDALNKHLKATGQSKAAVRLPSEAEWEYACRAGTKTRFYFGDSLTVGDQSEDDGIRSLYMWYDGTNVPYGSKEVGDKLPNAWGLYDMHGNLYEWCEDDWHEDYVDAPADGSARVFNPRVKGRVIRSGGWHESARWCRSARRHVADVRVRTACLGFRVAMDK